VQRGILRAYPVTRMRCTERSYKRSLGYARVTGNPTEVTGSVCQCAETSGMTEGMYDHVEGLGWKFHL
jgi:hypothetical protein